MPKHLGTVILVTSSIVFCVFVGGYIKWLRDIYTGMRHTTTFRSTTDCIYDGGPIRLYYNTYHFQSLLFTNECTNGCLKNNIKIYIKIARRIAAAEMKYMRRTARYTWADYKTNSDIAKELEITPVLDKLLEYKRNWIQRVNRMPRDRLPRIMKHYSPTGRRNRGRPLKRLLDT